LGNLSYGLKIKEEPFAGIIPANGSSSYIAVLL